ncbi:protein-export chaperone SecB [Vibrio penaeicida]|uniref:protein-export chaperone SecB n=1 Tax=Vibrio penaeicida TaxID=104609 RepID=UPI002735FB34|nr:protein-export chaperone SecB [Vibrio penaeicida]MDP2573268.1 protein-export chaperone SecB [Vibrio penaeicida]
MPEQHPIQIKFVDYIKLYIEKNANTTIDCVPNCGDFQLQSAHSSFDEESNEIWVKVNCKIGFNDEDEPIEDADFWLDVSLEACFSVDIEKFSRASLHHWAHNNATMVLYPYVRESVASLTGRVFTKEQALLPLLTVPIVPQSK